MLGLEAAGASLGGRPKAAADAIASWRIAHLLGDREADAGLLEVTRIRL